MGMRLKVMTYHSVNMPLEQIAEFCQRHSTVQ